MLDSDNHPFLSALFPLSRLGSTDLGDGRDTDGGLFGFVRGLKGVGSGDVLGT